GRAGAHLGVLLPLDGAAGAPPLVAKRLGHDSGANTFTLLLACMGVGAVFTATQMPKLRARWTRDHFTLYGTTVTGICIALIAYVPNRWAAVPVMVVTGMAWILVANAVTTAAQLALPDWVRARGMSMYQMAI